MDRERFSALVLGRSFHGVGPRSVFGRSVVLISRTTGQRFPGQGDAASISPRREGGRLT